MTDQELRALVRDAVARHLGPRAGASAPVAPRLETFAQTAAGPTLHPSHAIYLSVVNADDACVIQPSVQCDHCGYCKSHGH
jgi:hypothetical protein